MQHQQVYSDNEASELDFLGNFGTLGQFGRLFDELGAFGLFFYDYMDIFFRHQGIFYDTKNAICPMPSAPEVFPISICIVVALF